VTNVIGLVRGPLSPTEAVVLYATAAVGATPSELPSLTGLAEETIEDALAQLVRRGLIQRTPRQVRRTTTRPAAPRRLSLLHGHQPVNPTKPPLPAA
jgi:DNA-binding transcriptional MocR family regulator